MNRALEVPVLFLGVCLVIQPSPRIWPNNACPCFCSGDSLNCSRSVLVNLLFVVRGMLLKIFNMNSPAPFSIPLANKNNNKLGGNSQKLMLLSLGNHLSIRKNLPSSFLMA